MIDPSEAPEGYKAVLAKAHDSMFLCDGCSYYTEFDCLAKVDDISCFAGKRNDKVNVIFVKVK